MDKKLLLVVLAVILVGGGIWYFAPKTSQPSQITNVHPASPPTAAPPPSPQQPESSSSQQLEGWKTFRSDKYGFQFKYPPEYSWFGTLQIPCKEFCGSVSFGPSKELDNYESRFDLSASPGTSLETMKQLYESTTIAKGGTSQPITLGDTKGWEFFFVDSVSHKATLAIVFTRENVGFRIYTPTSENTASFPDVLRQVIETFEAFIPNPPALK